MAHITDSLSGQNIFNLTDRPLNTEIMDWINHRDRPLNTEIMDWINHGAKFNPYVRQPLHLTLQKFDDSFIDSTNRIFKCSLRTTKVLSGRSTIHRDLNALKQNKPGSRKLISSLQTNYTAKRSQLKHYLHRLNYCSKNSALITDAALEQVFNLEDGRIIVESDKKLGFVILDSQTYLKAYAKINVEQHFVESDITEEWYITNIVDYIKKAGTNIPVELSKIIKPSDFINSIESPSLGHLRLLPKIQKLTTVNHSEVDRLRCRGIKSSLQDPIKIIQKALDSIFGHLLYFIEEEFISKLGRLSPSISGVNEALDRIKQLKTGSWGTTAQLDADFENMYSNCHRDLLKKHVRHAAELAGFNEDTIQYIFNLIHVNMEHSYFKEPNGIFHTTRGYSMGDMSASKGSEVILRDSELGTFTVLQARGLLDKVDDYYRFKDEIHAHPDGTFDQVLDAIHIIATTYPQEIQLNVEINIIQGKFLTLRLYNQIDTDNMYTTILWKKNSKYDIIPADSNTCVPYKSCAGRTYFDMTRTHCSDPFELSRQVNIVRHILKLKNFKDSHIRNMSKIRRLRRYLTNFMPEK